MKLLFAGGADISVPALRKLCGEYPVAAVLTHPDTRAGRGKKKSLNPVKAEALALGIPVIEAENVDETLGRETARYNADLLVVVAYGKLFPKSFLSLFPEGGINLHPSLLPKYRGPSPAAAAVLNGDEYTGITVQRIANKMDAGDILLQKTVRLAKDETAGSLLKKVAEPGAELLLEGVRGWADGSITPQPQDDAEATYCRIIRKEDGLVDWKENTEQIEREVRGYDPWPRAYTFYGEKKLLILDAAVYEPPPEVAGRTTEGPSEGKIPGKVMGIDKKEGILIQTGNGVLAVRRLQLQAKKALDWKAFINGNQQFVGSQLGRT